MARRNEKQWVALSSVLAAVLLTSTKLGVGLWTNSLGILSEAAHSGLDLVAAVITLLAVRMADRPADHDHAYGHGKIENLSALAETFLLLLTCAWIIYEGVHRLLVRTVEVDASVWAFATIIVSIGIDVSRSRALKRVAEKYDSQALEADALHFSTDVWSSLVVLCGLVFVRVGQAIGVPWFARMDAIAALVVAGIVILVGVRLARRSIRDLLDTVPLESSRKLAAAALVPGVIAIRQLRVRKSGPRVFADITAAVPNSLSFAESHELASRIESAVRGVVPNVDAVVHAEPVEAAAAGATADDEDAVLLARVKDAVRGVCAQLSPPCELHGVSMRASGGERFVWVHCRMPGDASIEAAHRATERLERQLRDRLPSSVLVTVRVEPQREG